MISKGAFDAYNDQKKNFLSLNWAIHLKVVTKETYTKSTS